uniref:Uncharacterized protein n=1 Tax=Physcomitrium patens TaxID=3218 RepID=A0A7I4D3M9_PHYPA
MAGEETPKSIEPVTKEDSPMTEDLAKEEITHSEKDLPITDEACTRVMIAVNQCSKGYPKPSISSRAAFDWIVKNLIKPCCKKRYKLLILHVQVLDEDGLKELDSVYASPSDFQHLRHEERAKGASLIQYFIQKCHDSEVLILEDIMLSLLANSLASIISIQKGNSSAPVKTSLTR